MPDLFDPLRVKSWELPSRLVMAPLTRNRAIEGMVPGDLAVEYYRQRASAGLIISEGTQPSAVGQGYPATPGIHTPEQVAGWRRVADAVHGETRPACISWTTMRPLSPCTASATRRQPATCSGVWMPGVAG